MYYAICLQFFEDEYMQGSAEVTCGMYDSNLVSINSEEEEKFG